MRGGGGGGKEGERGGVGGGEEEESVREEEEEDNRMLNASFTSSKMILSTLNPASTNSLGVMLPPSLTDKKKGRVSASVAEGR